MEGTATEKAAAKARGRTKERVPSGRTRKARKVAKVKGKMGAEAPKAAVLTGTRVLMVRRQRSLSRRQAPRSVRLGTEKILAERRLMRAEKLFAIYVMACAGIF